MGFLQNLSSGIFERLSELNQEKDQQDQQQKASLINLMAGLADKVEPDSLPLLMGHIGELTGINKNKKFKGFWDAFSGLPSQDMGQRLGETARGIFGSMMGPQQAKDIRLRGNISQRGIPGLVGAAPTSEYGQKAAADVQGLKNKMVFRDPYQQKIDEIEARSAANLNNQLLMQNQRNEAAATAREEQYQNRSKLQQEEHDRKSQLAVDQMAQVYLNHPEVKAMPQIYQMDVARKLARDFLERKSELQLKEFTTKQSLRGSLERKADREGTGNTPAQKLAQKRLNYTISKDRTKYVKDISDAEATVGTLTPQVENAWKSVEDWAKEVKMTRDELLKSKLSTMGPIGKSVKTYKDLQEKLDAARKTIETGRSELEKFDRENPQKQVVPPPKATKGVGFNPPPSDGTPRGGSTWGPKPGASIFGLDVPAANPPTPFPTPKGSVRGSMYQDVYRIRADRSEAGSWKEGDTVSPRYLKGEWIVGELETDDKGIPYRVIRIKK